MQHTSIYTGTLHTHINRSLILLPFLPVPALPFLPPPAPGSEIQHPKIPSALSILVSSFEHPPVNESHYQQPGYKQSCCDCQFFLAYVQHGHTSSIVVQDHSNDQDGYSHLCGYCIPCACAGIVHVNPKALIHSSGLPLLLCCEFIHLYLRSVSRGLRVRLIPDLRLPGAVYVTGKPNRDFFRAIPISSPAFVLWCPRSRGNDPGTSWQCGRLSSWHYGS